VLAIALADENVTIHGRLIYRLELSFSRGALIDGFQEIDRSLDGKAGAEEKRTSQKRRHRLAWGIAAGAGADEGDDKIGSVGDSPDGKGLAEILLVSFHVPVRCDIEHAGKADGTICGKAANIRSAGFGFPLQQIIYAIIRFSKIGEEVVNSLANERRKNMGIDLRYRPHNEAIKVIVHLVENPIRLFERIMSRILWSARARGEERDKQDREKRAGTGKNFHEDNRRERAWKAGRTMANVPE